MTFSIIAVCVAVQAALAVIWFIEVTSSWRRTLARIEEARAQTQAYVEERTRSIRRGVWTAGDRIQL